jgi:D-glycero-D-manno-heptose 1,7-bisphosphate phosphatase
MMGGGLFLDRDGTIIEELEYISSPSQVRLIPRSAQAIRQANLLGLKVFVISNQSGVARGLLSEREVELVHDALVEQLKKAGAAIDAIYYCPHHPDYGDSDYRKTCECRKPAIGMLREAAEKFSIDLRKSYVVGDRISDMEAGKTAGAVSILVRTGYGSETISLLDGKRDCVTHVADDLFDAVEYIRSVSKVSTRH